MKMRNTSRKWLGGLVVGLCIALMAFPVLFVLIHSFGQDSGTVLLPEAWTLENWKEVLLYQPGYLTKFWISLGGCSVITAGQLLVSILGGFAFAKYRFPGKSVLYFLLMVLMMMPVQVTLVPNYIVLNALHLLGTWGALILPAMFLPFGTVFLTQIIRAIPNEVLEAARLDGAGTGRILVHIVSPMAKGGLSCLTVLTFVDAWNMVEQPMTFLSRPEQYPLSVFLAAVQPESAGTSFACSILALLPVTLLYLYYRQELIEGLVFMGVK